LFGTFWKHLETFGNILKTFRFFVEHFGKIVEQKAWLQRSFVESLT